MSYSNPKLIISNYYDSLIRRIDIYTEEKLAKHKDDEIYEFQSNPGGHLTFVLPKPPKLPENNEITIDHDFGNESKYDAYRFFNVNIQDFDDKSSFLDSQQTTKMNIHDYLNKTRDELIAELEKAQEQTFIHYESIKDTLKKDEAITNCENDEERTELVKSLLFDKKFAFILNIEKMDYLQELDSPFKLYLVVLDFYVNRNERELLKYS